MMKSDETVLRGMMTSSTAYIAATDRRIEFPVLGSPILDGVRVMISRLGLQHHHRPMSRVFNAHFSPLIKEVIRQDMVLECELYHSNMTAYQIAEDMNVKDIILYVHDIMSFDEWQEGGEQPYIERYGDCIQWCERHAPAMTAIGVIERAMIKTTEDSAKFLKHCERANYRGIHLHKCDGLYVHGEASCYQGCEKLSILSADLFKNRENMLWEKVFDGPTIEDAIIRNEMSRQEKSKRATERQDEINEKKAITKHHAARNATNLNPNTPFGQ